MVSHLLRLFLLFLLSLFMLLIHYWFFLLFFSLNIHTGWLKHHPNIESSYLSFSPLLVCCVLPSFRVTDQHLFILAEVFSILEGKSSGSELPQLFVWVILSER